MLVQDWQDRAGQGRAGQGRAGQGRAGQGRAGQGRARQGKAGKGEARRGEARRGEARQGKARQGKARQDKASHQRRQFKDMQRESFRYGTWDLKSWLTRCSHSASTLLSETRPSWRAWMLECRYKGGTSPPPCRRADTASSVSPSVTWQVSMSTSISITYTPHILSQFSKYRHRSCRAGQGRAGQGSAGQGQGQGRAGQHGPVQERHSR